MSKFFALLCALALSLPAFSADLDDKTLIKWMNSYAAVMTWSKTQDQKQLEFLQQEQNKNLQFDHLFTSALGSLKSQPAMYNDFSNVLKKNGYSDVDEWAGLGDRIMAANMAVELEKRATNPAQARAQMQQTMQEVSKNPNLTPEQKEQMQRMMAMGNKLIDITDKVPAEDKAVVKRNEALIQQVMGQNTPKN